MFSVDSIYSTVICKKSPKFNTTLKFRTQCKRELCNGIYFTNQSILSHQFTERPFSKQQTIFPSIIFHVNQFFKFQSTEHIIAILSIYLFLIFALKSILVFSSQFTKICCQKLAKCISNMVESTILYSLILGISSAQIYRVFSFKYLSFSKLIHQLRQAENRISRQVFRPQLRNCLLVFAYIFYRKNIVHSRLFIGMGIFTEIQTFRSIGVALTFSTMIVSLSLTARIVNIGQKFVHIKILSQQKFVSLYYGCKSGFILSSTLNVGVLQLL